MFRPVVPAIVCLLFFSSASPVRADILDYMPSILAASSIPAPAENIAGLWDLHVVFADSSTADLQLSLTDDSGDWESCEAYGRDPITVSGDSISFEVEGYTFSGTIASTSSMSGTWDQGTWTMTKVSSSAFCPPVSTWDLSAPLPEFVNHDFTEIGKISRVSRFRSGIGHDYSDDFESCRSMKHYYEPSVADWGSLIVTSPVAGMVVAVQGEWAGSQVHIRSTAQPAFTFILFHVDLASPLELGDTVTEGQVLGTHIGNQTTQDIAVRVNVSVEGKTNKYVSFFKLMTDALFGTYSGLSVNRDDFIITEAQRDADPLICNGEEFQDSGNLDNYVP